jgi:hypothetical protein
MNHVNLLDGKVTTLPECVFGLCVAFLLSLVLRWHFCRYGGAMLERRDTANTLPFIVLIVSLIIMIVHSSLSLGVGLMGTLSLVRFRTPIKQTRELAYLFMAIALGIGIGAGAIELTVVGSTFIFVVIAILARRQTPVLPQPIQLTVRWPANAPGVSLTDITRDLGALGQKAALERLEVAGGFHHALFSFEGTPSSELISFLNGITAATPGLEYLLLDQSASAKAQEN